MYHKKRLSCHVTSQTLWNLHKLAKMAKCGDNLGKVVDKLVREKMIELREWEKLNGLSEENKGDGRENPK